MEGGVGNDGISWEDLREARRLQELFQGRFSENDAVRLYQHCNRDLQETINFVFEGEPREIRNLLGEGEWRVVAARTNRDINEVRRNKIPDQVRQFVCEECDYMWWRRVPSRKKVSRCNVCDVRFEAIPGQNEWGWAEHQCRDDCGHLFGGFAEMNVTRSPCYRCGKPCLPARIIPPNERPERNIRSGHRHSCSAPNCYNRDLTDLNNVQINSRCVHPRSLDRQVLNPSRHHHSTSSTVNTFLDQDDLED